MIKRPPDDETRALERNTQPPDAVHTLRIEYAEDASGTYPPRLNHFLPGWHRDFIVSGKNTLEQLSSAILQILDWDRNHLYEFRIGEQAYAYLGEDELFVDWGTFVSCDIPIHLLGLAPTNTFIYLYDYGSYHVFRVTVLDVQPFQGQRKPPALLSHKGKNILQYPRMMSRKKERAFQEKPPSFDTLEPRKDRWRIRFILPRDEQILMEWRKSNDKTLWQKAVTVWENWNLLPEGIATKVERPLSDIREWIKAFNRYGIEGLKPHKKPRAVGARQARRDQKRKRILEILHGSPRAYGINRSNWSHPSLASAYGRQYGEAMSRSTVGHLLKMSGYGIRKARKVLSSPDPDYREKVDLVLRTLQNLKPGELFFFVDELGPLRVKKYGGRAILRKDETCSFPQNQVHSGVITMAGALSATTNQITWIYIRSKDTSAMIELAEILFNQHAGAPKVYITWDAASWHKSAPLVEWLDKFNEETHRLGEGPIIQLVPLPTSSQFLDVIEAVFSGMKRAVIHHSNYRSEEEMKSAISRHFVERNIYFQANPRRAGKKIWELDFFSDYENIRSGIIANGNTR